MNKILAENNIEELRGWEHFTMGTGRWYKHPEVGEFLISDYDVMDAIYQNHADDDDYEPTDEEYENMYVELAVLSCECF